MKRYHFSLGNSSEGPIGFCAAVTANSRKQAVKILRDALPVEVNPHVGDGDQRIEYVEVYFNADAITEANIDEEDKA